jgi:DNA-binding response OmpR family regulator
MNGKKGVVVVVETDDLIRGLLERWLGEAGYSMVEEIEEGGRAARATRPVLVIANVSNPRGAPALIRSMQAIYAAPVLVLSARFQRGLGASTAAAHRLGVRKVLPKPFTRKEFLGAVKEAIEDPS